MNIATRYSRRLIAGDFSQGQAFWAILVPLLLIIKTTGALLALSNAIENPVISTRIWLPILAFTLIILLPIVFAGCLRAIYIAQQKFKGGYQSILLFLATLYLMYLTGLTIYQQLPLLTTMTNMALTRDTMSLNVSVDDDLLRLDGQLTYGSAKTVKQWLAKNPKTTTVELNLDGGHLHEARAVARVIIDHDLDTLVTGRCAASCMLVLVAGQQRSATASAQLKFHRTLGYDNGYRNEWIMERERQRDRHYYQRRGVAPSYLNPIYYKQRDNGYLQPSLDILLSYGVINHIIDEL